MPRTIFIYCDESVARGRYYSNFYGGLMADGTDLREKPEGARRRGRRTIQKQRVYKHISRRIREIYPNFNIGVSTAQPNGPADRWSHPYRHWCFVPKASERDDSLTKKGKAP